MFDLQYCTVVDRDTRPPRWPQNEWAETMDKRSGAAGIAALAICESLLLALTENNVLGTDEVRALLEDAANANRNAIPLLPDGGHHGAAADLIDFILAGGNSIRFG